MIDTAATNYDIFDGHIVLFRELRRNIRAFVDDAAIGLATDAAACALVTAFAFTAAWLIDTTISTNADRQATVPIRPAAVGLANHNPKAVPEVGIPTSNRIWIDHADTLTFKDRWGRATVLASTPADVLPHLPQHAVEHPQNVALFLPHPMGPLQSLSRSETISALDSMLVAKSALARAPSPAPDSIQTFLPQLIIGRANIELPAPRHPIQNEVARSQVGQAMPQTSTAVPPPAAPTSDGPVTPQLAYNKSIPPPDLDNRTAVYDISAHTVYMPNGVRLEAHSGLGNKLDDPRYVSVKDRGPTPPNVYYLALREKFFHGIPVIRLIPSDSGNMFGRNGILAHPYMLSANGQSNGCVSIKNYSAFLDAYLRGEVDRLVVVPYIGNVPGRIASDHRQAVRQYAGNDP